MTRLVSAEEARGLLEGSTPGPMSAAADANGNGSTWCVRDDRGVRVALLGANDGPDASLLAAAPDLAATVIALSESAIAEQAIADEACRARDAAQRNERDHLGALRVAQAERDRLRDILACERGERAPEGWTWGNDDGKRREHEWIKAGPRLGAGVWRGPCNIEPRWYWQTHESDGSRQGFERTALEAIEAADRAAATK